MMSNVARRLHITFSLDGASAMLFGGLLHRSYN
jgi:hypothetical protein